MSVPKQYVIQLTGIRNMTNEYDYQLDNTYFECMGDNVVKGGNVHAHVDIEHHDTGATLQLSIDGSVTVACDRCLSPMTIDIATDDSLKVVYGDHYEDDGDTVTIDEHEGRIDLADILFELIALQVPLQHTHPEGECDEEMANILRKFMVTDTTEET